MISAFDKRILVTVSVLACLVPAGIVLASDVTAVKGAAAQFDDASKAYKDKKYSQSLSQFKQLHDSGRCNDMVHYYMALCYQSLSQISFAQSEYTLVSQSKDVNLKTYATQALSAIDEWKQHRLYQGSGYGFARYSRPPVLPSLAALRQQQQQLNGGGC
jgi:hypothetical protein